MKNWKIGEIKNVLGIGSSSKCTRTKEAKYKKYNELKRAYLKVQKLKALFTDEQLIKAFELNETF
jgi:arsenate reductase-like glutaredoxin family protein